MKLQRQILKSSLLVSVSTVAIVAGLVFGSSSTTLAVGAGAAAAGGVAGGAGGGVGGPGVSLGSGLGNPTGGGVFVPGAINTSGAYNSPQNNLYGGYGGGFAGILAGLAASGAIGGPAGPTCAFPDAQLGTNTDQNLAYTNAYGGAMGQAQYDGMANQYAYPPQADQRAWGNLGQQFNSKLNGNCQQKFITKDGKLGQWGLETYGQIKAHSDSFLTRTPRDMPQFCPRFNSFSPDAKARFYTYLFMSMAQPESTCNPGAVGKGPNGSAIGLFQLETPACNRVGVHGSSQDLLQPKHNIDCAVALLGSELDKRGSITVGTSRGFTGTYWATLRSDAVQRAASSNGIIRQDGNAAKATASLLGQFKECQTGENPSNNPSGGIGHASIDPWWSVL